MPFDATPLQHACALLIAFCFWGSFRFGRATRGVFATTRWAPLITSVVALIIVGCAYVHPAMAVFAASMTLPLLGQKHFQAAIAEALGADTYQEHALEFIRVAGCGPYLRGAAASGVPWIAFGVVLLTVSGGQNDLLYWTASGLTTAHVIGFLSAVHVALRFRSRRESTEGTSAR